MARARERDRLRPHLSEFACPVLLLLGGAPHDGGPRPGEVIELAESLPAFTVDTVPAVGAFVQEERPEAVVAAVARLDAGPAPPTTPPALTAPCPARPRLGTARGHRGPYSPG